MQTLHESDENKNRPQRNIHLTAKQNARFKLAVDRVEVRYGNKKNDTVHYRGCTLPDGTQAGMDITIEANAHGGATISTEAPISNWFLRKDTKVATNVLSIFRSAKKLLPEFDRITESDPKSQIREPFKLMRPAVPIPFDGQEPKLVFKGKFLGHNAIAPSKLTNVFATGATGSGKTFSCMFTFQDALLSYQLPCGRTASVLIIDPKFELLERARKSLNDCCESDRLTVMGECAPIQYFSDEDGMSLSDRYAAVLSFLPISDNGGDGARWQQKADQLMRDLLAIDQEFLDATGIPLLESVLTVVTLADHMQTGQWRALLQILQRGMSAESELRLVVDVMEVLWILAGMEVKPLPLNRYVGMEHGAEQFFYLARLGSVVAEVPGSLEIKDLIDFSTRLGLQKNRTTSVKQIVNSGGVLLYQPASSLAHDVVGKAIKTLFLSAVLQRDDMLRPVGYLCDEAHRWMTSDRVTGEASFLDRSRAYRVVAVLASQSIPSILGAMDARYDKHSALASILANSPTKLMFRNTDPTTAHEMKSFIPGSPVSGIHILDARPPSTLRTGEYYYQMGNEWGRAQYQPFTERKDVVIKIMRQQA